MADKIDPGSDRPVYLQIADHLRAAVVRGEFQSGDRLPSETELMASYGAARGTVRQAINTLRAEGHIEVHHGRGAFVTRRPPIQRRAFDRFARAHRNKGKAAYLAEMEQHGRKPDVQVLEVTTAVPSPEVAQRLALAAHDLVLVRRRRYLADGEPTELATSYLPLELVAGTKIVEENPGPGGIYARLEELGHELQRFEEDVRSRMPLPEEAKALHLPVGVPVFLLTRTAFDVQGRPVEVCDTVMRADAWVLTYELPAH